MLHSKRKPDWSMLPPERRGGGMGRQARNSEGGHCVFSSSTARSQPRTCAFQRAKWILSEKPGPGPAARSGRGVRGARNS